MVPIIFSAFVSLAVLPLDFPQKAAQEESTPHYLYKVVSIEAWKASQGEKSLKLSADDQTFIHLSREDQLERITSKYWAKASEYVVLRLDASKLPGKMVYEANPGGASKYYHLYDGSIPLEAISESKVIKK